MLLAPLLFRYLLPLPRQLEAAGNGPQIPARVARNPVFDRTWIHLPRAFAETYVLPVPTDSFTLLGSSPGAAEYGGPGESAAATEVREALELRRLVRVSGGVDDVRERLSGPEPPRGITPEGALEALRTIHRLHVPLVAARALQTLQEAEDHETCKSACRALESLLAPDLAPARAAVAATPWPAATERLLLTGPANREDLALWIPTMQLLAGLAPSANPEGLVFLLLALKRSGLPFLERWLVASREEVMLRETAASLGLRRPARLPGPPEGRPAPAAMVLAGFQPQGGWGHVEADRGSALVAATCSAVLDCLAAALAAAACCDRQLAARALAMYLVPSAATQLLAVLEAVAGDAQAAAPLRRSALSVLSSLARLRALAYPVGGSESCPFDGVLSDQISWLVWKVLVPGLHPKQQQQASPPPAAADGLEAGKLAVSAAPPSPLGSLVDFAHGKSIVRAGLAALSDLSSALPPPVWSAAYARSNASAWLIRMSRDREALLRVTALDLLGSLLAPVSGR